MMWNNNIVWIYTVLFEKIGFFAGIISLINSKNNQRKLFFWRRYWQFLFSYFFLEGLLIIYWRSHWYQSVLLPFLKSLTVYYLDRSFNTLLMQLYPSIKINKLNVFLFFMMFFYFQQFTIKKNSSVTTKNKFLCY